MPLLLFPGPQIGRLRAAGFLLYRNIVVEFELPSAHAPDHPPAMVASEIGEFGLRKRSQDVELGRMRDKIFGLDGQDPFNLSGEGREIRVRHFGHCGCNRRLAGGFLPAGLPSGAGGGFGLRFSLLPKATLAFRLGDGPRAVGFSIDQFLHTNNVARGVTGLVFHEEHPIAHLRASANKGDANQPSPK